MEAWRDSRVVAARVAMDQLDALGAELFDIGVKRTDGTMLLREAWALNRYLSRCSGYGVKTLIVAISCAVKALLEMGEGPPESACRSRFQTTPSCEGKEP